MIMQNREIYMYIYIFYFNRIVQLRMDYYMDRNGHDLH